MRPVRWALGVLVSVLLLGAQCNPTPKKCGDELCGLRAGIDFDVDIAPGCVTLDFCNDVADEGEACTDDPCDGDDLQRRPRVRQRRL